MFGDLKSTKLSFALVASIAASSAACATTRTRALHIEEVEFLGMTPENSLRKPFSAVVLITLNNSEEQKEHEVGTNLDCASTSTQKATANLNAFAKNLQNTVQEMAKITDSRLEPSFPEQFHNTFNQIREKCALELAKK